ncbi:MAG: hypothetical protein ACRC63_00950 [Metamycoplasmataceae bacterium]
MELIVIQKQNLETREITVDYANETLLISGISKELISEQILILKIEN